MFTAARIDLLPRNVATQGRLVLSSLPADKEFPASAVASSWAQTERPRGALRLFLQLDQSMVCGNHCLPEE